VREGGGGGEKEGRESEKNGERGEGGTKKGASE